MPTVTCVWQHVASRGAEGLLRTSGARSTVVLAVRAQIYSCGRFRRFLWKIPALRTS